MVTTIMPDLSAESYVHIAQKVLNIQGTNELSELLVRAQSQDMIPDSLKDKLSIRQIRPEILDETILKGPPGYTVYQWTNKQIEGIKLEAMMPGEIDQEVIPLVLIETPDRPFRASGWLMRREKN